MSGMSSGGVEAESHTDPAEIDMNMIPSLTEEVVVRSTNRNLRMAFDRASGVMFEFNDTASSFLALVDGERSFRAISQRLAEEYDAEGEAIEADLRDLIARMIDGGIISIRQEG